MKIHRLETTNGFIVFDLDEAETAVGITRCAPKVLQDGAVNLARSITYGAASFGLRISGGSGAVSAPADQRDAAVAAYVAEVSPLVAERRWLTSPGTGITEADLAPLRASDPRPPALWTEGLEATLTGQGAVAAADAAGGGLAGARVAVVGGGPVVEAAKAAATALGVEEVTDDDAADSGCDVLLMAGRPGALDHEAASGVKANVVAPLTPVVVTAKGLATLERVGIVVVPDFIATAAPLVHAFGEGDAVARVRQAMSEVTDAGAGAWRAAVERAEEFLLTWQDELPFGRPLA